jgi:hypothetical protein
MVRKPRLGIPALLARYGDAGQWRANEGVHRVAVGRSAEDLVLKGEAPVTVRQFGR